MIPISRTRATKRGCRLVSTTTPKTMMYCFLFFISIIYLFCISQLHQAHSPPKLPGMENPTNIEQSRDLERAKNNRDSMMMMNTAKAPLNTTAKAPVLDLMRDPASPPVIDLSKRVNYPLVRTKGQKMPLSMNDIIAGHTVAGLSCAGYGGPDDPSEMVYWRDIEADTEYHSPLYEPDGEELYMTFEPDEGGWNNIRMALETAIALAFSMGRTLVLPPKMKFYLLQASTKKDENVMSYDSFFHMESIAAEHKHFKIITFEQYLAREKGKLRNRFTGELSDPPDNRTDWSSIDFSNYQSTREGLSKRLWEWMRNVSQPLEWNPDKCVAAFPSKAENAKTRLEGYLRDVYELDKKQYPDVNELARPFHRLLRYINKPTPVDGTALDRLRELIVDRKEICVYEGKYQQAKTVHALGETATGFRLLIHFYAYLYFEDWRQDLHMKRFLRDHLRYRDAIQCAAARIVKEVRRIALDHSKTDQFDSIHVRHGDFQFKEMQLTAADLYHNHTKPVLQEGATLFIATDERNLTFFEPLAEHYNLLFLNNFTHLIKDINPNFYGMLDQLIAARGKVFFGSYFSTFSGYINRLRGYHVQKMKGQGYKTGFVDSYHYVPPKYEEQRKSMRTYSAVRQPFWAQEYPVGWANIDHGIDG